MEGHLNSLITTFAQPGAVQWLGVRPARREPMVEVRSTEITLNCLAGDRHDSPSKRAVSLIQWEHLAVIASLMGNDAIDPLLLRRNIVVSGINLLGLRKAELRVGSGLLRGTGLCAPCSRMEETLGNGGYSAVRGHGGITAEVVEVGVVNVGDVVEMAPKVTPVFTTNP